jgi:hypothetical protein
MATGALMTSRPFGSLNAPDALHSMSPRSSSNRRERGWCFTPRKALRPRTMDDSTALRPANDLAATLLCQADGFAQLPDA